MTVLKFTRGPRAQAPKEPLAVYALSMSYLHNPERDRVNLVKAHNWIEALNLGLKQASMDVNFNAEIIPSQLKIERRK